MTPEISHTVWSQWPDLKVPVGFRKLSNLDFPLDSSDLSAITIYIPPYMTGVEFLAPIKQMNNLKILQVPNAGYEDALPYIRDGITLCNARGVHNASTAELAVGLAIAIKRGFPNFIRSQDRGQWNHKRMGSLNDSKIGIVGAGSIGQTLVSYLKPYDVEITTFSRSGSNGSLTIDKLDEHLPEFDFLFLIIPLNAQSKHLIDQRRLALMRDGSTLVNIARGGIVDTDALVAELNSGRIYAAVDVTDPEPLPHNHPLWSAKNTLITPHVGGDSQAFEKRGKRFVEEQLQRIASGEDPINIIDVTKLE
ncbi:MAG TPA: 2-hydroxyacid dehydrogenase [Candidatus Nanopelagicaceae bacterium]